MSNAVMLALGGYRFSVSTSAYQTLQRSSRYRWQEQSRVGTKPAMQFLGPESDSITLEGEILPHFRGGLDQVNKMRAEAGQGKPLILTDSFGQVWGKWCIVDINETWDDLTETGLPRFIQFRLTLREYGEDSREIPNP